MREVVKCQDILTIGGTSPQVVQMMPDAQAGQKYVKIVAWKLCECIDGLIMVKV